MNTTIQQISVYFPCW